MAKSTTMAREFIQSARTNLSKTVQRAKVIEIAPPLNAKLRCVRGGSIIAITGSASSVRLKKIAAAANDGSFTHLDQLLDESVDRVYAWGLKRRKKRLPPKAVTSVTDFYYHGTEITSGQFMAPGLDLVFSVMPFSGGKLDLEAFEAHEYTQSEAPGPVTLVIVSQPHLNELEQKILAKVPVTDTGSVIGKPVTEFAIVAATAAILLGAGVFYGLYKVYQHMKEQQQKQQQANQQVAYADDAEAAELEAEVGTEDDADVENDEAVEDDYEIGQEDDAIDDGDVDGEQLIGEDINEDANQEDVAFAENDDNAEQVGYADEADADVNVGADDGADAGIGDAGAGDGGDGGDGGGGGGGDFSPGYANALQAAIDATAAALSEVDPAAAARVLLRARAAMIAASIL